MHPQRKSLNFGLYVPNDKILNKKVPENPRYKNIKPAVDTGKNVKRYIDELKEKQNSYTPKKDEVFNRVKFSTFIKLAISVAKDNFLSGNIEEERIPEEILHGSGDSKKVEKVKLNNVLVGVGEIDLRNEKKKIPVFSKREKKVPYLLLDVREQDQFLQCHIKTAKHYPSAMLSRTNGYETEEMKQYKNCNPELIILYDEDESIASRVATTLMQRGYENIYLLTGGLKLGYEVFPRGLMTAICTGHFPITKLGSTGIMQVAKPSTEFFTQQDIDIIQQYVESYSHQNNPGSCSKSNFSQSKATITKTCSSYLAQNIDTVSHCGSFTSRRGDSACSVDYRRARTAPSKSAVSGDGRFKRAPWK